jgi:hypothetical protein
LTEQKEASGKKVSDMINKMKLLFEEYEKSLNEFGVRPTPLPADLGLPEFMEWIEAENQVIGTTCTVSVVPPPLKISPRNSPKLSIDGSPKPLGVLRRNLGEMLSTAR